MRGLVSGKDSGRAAGSGPTFDSLVSAPGLRAQIILSSLLINILALALPLSMLQVYDRILPHHSWTTTTVLMSGVAVSLVLECALRLARTWMLTRIAAKFERDAARAAMECALHAEERAFLAVPRTTHLERFEAIGRYRDFLSGPSTQSAYDLPFVIIYLAMLWHLGGPLTLVALGAVALHLTWAARLGWALQRATAEAERFERLRSEVLIGAMAGIHTVKALALEQVLSRRYEQLQESRARTSILVERTSTALQEGGAGTVQLATLMVASVGALLVIEGRLSAGALSACILMTGRALQPLQAGLGSWSRLQSARLARTHVEAMLDLPRERFETGPDAPHQLKGAILLDRVRLASAASNMDVLHGVSIDVRPGEMVAIRGSNLSGRSSLLALMGGRITPTKGQALVDGLDARLHRADVLHEQILLVTQDECLFRGTILENLCGFHPDRINRAAAMARRLGLDETISLLPAGYSTRVGDGAQGSLPRGTVQLIALVRAFAAKPPILLLDEANNSLDDSGDRDFRSLLEDARGRSTIIIVTQRPSIARLADRCLRLENGRLIAEEPFATSPASRTQRGENAPAAQVMVS